MLQVEAQFVPEGSPDDVVHPPGAVWVSFFDVANSGTPIDPESGDDLELTGRCRYRTSFEDNWTYDTLDAESIKL